jgi:protein-disulfide isomerase
MIDKKECCNGNSWMTPFLVLTLFTAVFSAYTFVKIQNLEKGVTGAPKVAAPSQGDQAAQPEPTSNVAAMPKIERSDYIRGNKKAKVMLVEYSDYECPFCKRFHDSMTQLMKDYGNKIGWVYRHYPLSFHANAQMESEAAECVGEAGGQDKFWVYTDMVYSKTTSTGTSFTKEQMVEMAGQIGVNKAKVKSCLDAGKFTQKIKEQMNKGAEAGVSGTPGTIVVVDGKPVELIPGALPLESIKASVDKLL